MQPKGLDEGVYLNLSMDEYHADPAIGGGAINDILVSEELFFYNSPLNPDREKLDTAAFKFGRVYHSMVLEPEKDFPFDIKKGVKTSKVEGMIGEGDYEELLRMYARLLKQPKHWNALHGGFAEVSIFWRDKATGLMCKIRPDNFAPEWVGDLKSLKSITSKSLYYDFPKMNYHVTGYRYSHGMQALKELVRNGYKLPEQFDDDFIARFMARKTQMFCFVMQEKNPPYSTRLWNMTPYSSELGSTYFHDALQRIKAFYENPKYTKESLPLAYDDVEDITEGMIYVNTNF